MQWRQQRQRLPPRAARLFASALAAWHGRHGCSCSLRQLFVCAPGAGHCKSSGRPAAAAGERARCACHFAQRAAAHKSIVQCWMARRVLRCMHVWPQSPLPPRCMPRLASPPGGVLPHGGLFRCTLLRPKRGVHPRWSGGSYPILQVRGICATPVPAGGAREREAVPMAAYSQDWERAAQALRCTALACKLATCHAFAACGCWLPHQLLTGPPAAALPQAPPQPDSGRYLRHRSCAQTPAGG